MKGKLLVIGFGPGSNEHITKRAREAIEESQVIIGYNTYVDLIRSLITDQSIVQTGMTEEVSRAQEAVRQAEAGKIVSVISSGDAGVYGMAGLIYEVLIEKGWNRADGVEVEIIPGISAIQSVASLLGAPVMHDACTISLSDHLTPWELIVRRVEAAAQADFVIALYNPRSGRRTRQIVETQRILLEYRSPDTPVGIVKSAYRDREHIVVTTLANMLDHDIGMLTTVIIGNSSTTVYDGLMITPRGYQRKYTLNTDSQSLRPHQRLQKEAEPWSMSAAEDRAFLFGEQEELQPAEPGWSPFELATEALELVSAGRKETGSAQSILAAMPAAPMSENTGAADEERLVRSPFRQEAVLEFAVSPGVANKKFSAQQMIMLAELVGEEGEIEYSPHHQLVVRIRTVNPQEATRRLHMEGFLLSPIGDIAQVKACDFCNLEKAESIPYAEEIHARIGNAAMPKELKIGFNGCGMACYGAVNEDIGIVYRRGKFDLFLGAKTVGRNAHAGQVAAEGISPEDIVDVVERIVNRFKTDGHPNERFHKFFKRVKVVEGFVYREPGQSKVEEAVCGD
ncbi:precorrin-3B C(17)-methyltransferase [Paenibacillus selenitireducens]|uniref:Precorrin-3B C(17)-methyltransferase n=1 Tax=Paenibacillus selenitireducens TaxID=1324314 RepID=A0A1T2XDE9_9BACL|nr:precorrin-3B C(17)-methyltransferase [Paenibacillus selenitireducens]OPA77706.1 precorrin-3B C(17)-methyltransferase [Paenibacillus selenitireducens]